MSDSWNADDDRIFEEVAVRRPNRHLRALWIIGGTSLILAIAGFAAGQTLFGPNGYGFSFDSNSIPVTYYIASAGSAASGPLLTGGLTCIALALGVGALSTHLTRLAEDRDYRIATDPRAAAPVEPVVSSPVAEPAPALDPRLFMRPPASGAANRA